MPVADVVQEMVDVVLPGVTVRPEMVGPEPTFTVTIAVEVPAVFVAVSV